MASDKLAALSGTTHASFTDSSLMTTDPSMLILVVDQNKAMIPIVRSLLKQIDFENVDDASNGTEALSKLRNGHMAWRYAI